MKILIGLGNPEKKYENTYHNLGFSCAEKAAEILGLNFSKIKCKASVAEGKINGEKIIIARPLTYMNLSGESVRELVGFYKADLKDIIVAYDDFDLKKGEVRIRESGSGGTHNGMRNIVKELGSESFARVRVGFKPNDLGNIPLIEFVLSGIKAEDAPIFSDAVLTAAKALVAFAEGKDFESIMREYNRKSS